MFGKLAIPAAVIAALALVLVAVAGSPRGTSASYTFHQEEITFIDLLNNYRVANNRVPLIIDPNIQAAAEWMSRDMGEKNYFSHTDSLGRSPWVRMCDFGYCWNTWKGENIAAGFMTGSGVFQGWKDSPGHNANMLGANYRVMGLSRVHVPGSTFNYYWTNDFGGHVVDGSATPTPTNSPAPTSTPTSTPTPTPTPPPTPTPTPTATPSPTPTPTPTPEPTPTATPAPSESDGPPPPPAPTATSTPDGTPPAPTPTLAPEEQRIDVDCDNELTGSDAMALMQFLAHVPQSTPYGCPPIGSQRTQDGTSPQAAYHGDLDCNGVVDARDALIVLRYIAGQRDVVCVS